MNAITPARRLGSAALLVAFAHLALELCQNFLPVVYPLIIDTMKLSYAQIGTLSLMVSIFGALMQPIFGYLSDRWDPRLIVVLSVTWSGLIMGLVGGIAYYVGSYWMLLPVVALGALGSAAFHPAGALLAATGDPQRRGTALSIFSVGGNLGSALSPLLVGVGLSGLGLPGTAIMIPAAALSGLYIHQRFRRYPLPDTISFTSDSGHRRRQGGKPGSWFTLSLLVVIVAARSWYQGSLMTYLPEWLQDQGQTLQTAGFIFSVLLVSLSIGSFSGGTLSDRVGRVPIVVTSLSLICLTHWVLLRSSGPIQLIFVSLTGMMIGATFPVVIVMAQEAWPQTVGLASSLVLGLGWLPSGLGSWVVGSIADQTSLTFALSTLSFVPLFGVVAVLIFAWRGRNREVLHG